MENQEAEIQSEENTRTLCGTVIFFKVNVGSKSEKLQPFLYQTQNQLVPLFMANSNPFENNAFKAFDGKLVQVTGIMKTGTFEVQQIQELQ